MKVVAHMTMNEIYANPEKWMNEIEEEWDYEYGSELNEAWDELED